MTLFTDRVPDPQLAEWPVYGERSSGAISSPSHVSPGSSSAVRKHICSTSVDESDSDSDNESTAFWHRFAKADDVRVRVITGPKLVRRGKVWLEPAREEERGDEETATGSQKIEGDVEGSESEEGHHDPGIVSSARGSITHDRDWGLRERHDSGKIDESSDEEGGSDGVTTTPASAEESESDGGHDDSRSISVPRDSSPHTLVRMREHRDSCSTDGSDTEDRGGRNSAKSLAATSSPPLIDFSPQASPAPLIEFSPLLSPACLLMEGMVMPSFPVRQKGDDGKEANDPFLGTPKHGQAWYMSDYTLAPPPFFADSYQHSRGRDRGRLPSPTPGPRRALGKARRLRLMPPPGLEFPRGRYHHVLLAGDRNYRYPQICDE
ncbi:hypothetical protein LTR91_017369 [Friedmanniomyces endolithicus]|uniref:Uncharacterized protein n=1 Tax=Friedmanniomyces endolithicus TaxID=329885 RepID=A0AAN6K690_9PEZI|nr:hypothetical protein LTS00_001104 [Friedmanniomyces endolithicus]KAK0305754.1 hypothetical protein LTR01_006538 [Friedmanniomyces endolithicus]KAK0830782.1 hypothetical protein LTR73_003168 [Friedmanniomyces endolithicus]KAK0912918.1 hypothetical protein LTR57_014664 [Friedmanniomyces endolithicus]KAK0964526.1 hypothetical protein LTS01_018791 [Friedmanniomyces endolithicus]